MHRSAFFCAVAAALPALASAGGCGGDPFSSAFSFTGAGGAPDTGGQGAVAAHGGAGAQGGGGGATASSSAEASTSMSSAASSSASGTGGGGGGGGAPCGPDTCSGCCDTVGACVAGTSDSACGVRGAACSPCLDQCDFKPSRNGWCISTMGQMVFGLQYYACSAGDCVPTGTGECCSPTGKDCNPATGDCSL